MLRLNCVLVSSRKHFFKLLVIVCIGFIPSGKQLLEESFGSTLKAVNVHVIKRGKEVAVFQCVFLNEADKYIDREKQKEKEERKMSIDWSE